MYDENDPLVRGQKLIDSMNGAQREKFEAVINQLKIEWAVLHGDISPLIVSALCKRAALDMDVSAITVDTQPANHIRQIAKNIGDREPFLQSSIDTRDADLRERLVADVENEVPDHRKMTLDRAGTYKQYVEQEVARKLDQRASARFQ